MFLRIASLGVPAHPNTRIEGGFLGPILNPSWFPRSFIPGRTSAGTTSFHDSTSFNYRCKICSQILSFKEIHVKGSAISAINSVRGLLAT